MWEKEEDEGRWRREGGGERGERRERGGEVGKIMLGYGRKDLQLMQLLSLTPAYAPPPTV